MLRGRLSRSVAGWLFGGERRPQRQQERGDDEDQPAERHRPHSPHQRAPPRASARRYSVAQLNRDLALDDKIDQLAQCDDEGRFDHG